MGDGRAHVGRRQMRHGGAVLVTDQAMHDRLGMHHHAELFRRQGEKEMRLDQFQPLVHQGGAVERNLAAHRPVGMGDRLFHRGGAHALQRPFAERAARGGDGDQIGFRGIARAQHLEDGIVLAVHRQDLGAGFLHGVAEHRARRHHAFLVGQRHHHAAADGGQRRLDARPRP